MSMNINFEIFLFNSSTLLIGEMKTFGLKVSILESLTKIFATCVFDISLCFGFSFFAYYDKQSISTVFYKINKFGFKCWPFY